MLTPAILGYGMVDWLGKFRLVLLEIQINEIS